MGYKKFSFTKRLSSFLNSDSRNRETIFQMQTSALNHRICYHPYVTRMKKANNPSHATSNYLQLWFTTFFFFTKIINRTFVIFQVSNHRLLILLFKWPRVGFWKCLMSQSPLGDISRKNMKLDTSNETRNIEKDMSNVHIQPNQNLFSHTFLVACK